MVIKRGKCLFIAVLLLLIPIKVNAQHLQFCREKISIEVKDNECELTGIYYFVNHGNVKIEQQLFYPFIVNDSLPFPFSYSIIDLKTGEKLNPRKTKSGIIFPVIVVPKDTSLIEVRYCQKTPQNMMEYILTTTQNWGQPFAIAEYEVKIPARFQLTEMEPAFDNIKVNEGFKVFNTLKKDFLPEKNFLIRWKGALR